MTPILDFIKEPLFLAVVSGGAGGVAGFYLPQIATYRIDTPPPPLTKRKEQWRLKGLFLYGVLGIFAAIGTSLKIALPDNTYGIGLANLMFVQFCVGMSGPQVLSGFQRIGTHVYSLVSGKFSLKDK